MHQQPDTAQKADSNLRDEENETQKGRQHFQAHTSGKSGVNQPHF